MLAAVKTTVRGAIHALDVCNGTFKIEPLHTACSLKVRAHDKARQSLRIAPLQDLPASGTLVEVTAELIPNSNGDFELHVFDAADIAQLTGGHSANG